MATGFFAYPSRPAEIGATIQAAIEVMRTKHGNRDITAWPQNDIAGKFIADPILENIDSSDFLFADISRLNFNVIYEIGYAIGKLKRVILLRNTSLRSADELIQQVGIFDTLGYLTYHDSKSLVFNLMNKKDKRPLTINTDISNASPVYILLPKFRTDLETHLLSRVKKSRIQFRSFDPDEQGRLSALATIDEISRSHGVIVPLLNSERADAEVHNLRAAFTAGLAYGMEKELLLLQFGNDPVPLDCRDFVSRITSPNQIDRYIGEFAPLIVGKLQQRASHSTTSQTSFLSSLSMGASSAENEMSELDEYYLETEEYRRTLRGEAQIVTGRKGSGKSALFFKVRNHLEARTKPPDRHAA